MKPYAANGKTPKKAGRKAKAVAGSVKKTVVKAKKNVVKAGKKKLNQAAKDEVDDLLEKTASGEAATVTLTPSVSGKAVAKTQLKKLKSIVSLKSYDKMEEEAETPGRRQSQRIKSQANPVKMNDSMDVSVAEEAKEVPAEGGAPGFLKKTMSRIWKIPSDVATGVSYGEINGHHQNGQDSTPAASSTNSKGCVIS